MGNVNKINNRLYHQTKNLFFCFLAKIKIKLIKDNIKWITLIKTKVITHGHTFTNIYKNISSHTSETTNLRNTIQPKRNLNLITKTHNETLEESQFNF